MPQDDERTAWTPAIEDDAYDYARKHIVVKDDAYYDDLDDDECGDGYYNE